MPRFATIRHRGCTVSRGRIEQVTQMDHVEPGTPAASARRQYDDADGVRWRVRERSPTDRPQALYFESEMAFRRVTHYPLDWQYLSQAELEALSHDP